MAAYKFDVAKLERLNDPGRFETLPPDVLWRALGAPSDPCAIVEIGAGTGLFAAEFAARCPGAIVYAVDTEPRMLAWMRANRREVADRRVVPVLSCETEVPLDDGIADALAMINLHHELHDPSAIYAEAFRLLMTGGRLVVADWAPRETPKGPPLASRVRPAELAATIERAGFIDVVIDEHALPWHLLATGVRP